MRWIDIREVNGAYQLCANREPLADRRSSWRVAAMDAVRLGLGVIDEHGRLRLTQH